jgi:hypothetical protein
MDNFVFHSHEGYVIFGSGIIKRMSDGLARLNLARSLILCTRQQLNQAVKLKEVLPDPPAQIGKACPPTYSVCPIVALPIVTSGWINKVGIASSFDAHK